MGAGFVKRADAQTGSTLVEVLVAFTIFVIALGVMIELFGGLQVGQQFRSADLHPLLQIFVAIGVALRNPAAGGRMSDRPLPLSHPEPHTLRDRQGRR